MMKQIRAISRTLLVSASLCTALLSTSSFAASQGELKGVSSEISRQQKALSSQQKKLDSLQASLKKQELSIAALGKAIQDSKKQLNTANANIASLDAKIKALTAQKKAHTDKLIPLLQTYYMTSRAKASSHILNTGVEEDRISHYYQHLAKARSTTIKTIEQTKLELEESHKQRQLEQEQIATLLKQQTTKRDKLVQTQTQRKKTVGSI